MKNSERYRHAGEKAGIPKFIEFLDSVLASRLSRDLAGMALALPGSNLTLRELAKVKGERSRQKKIRNHGRSQFPRSNLPQLHFAHVYSCLSPDPLQLLARTDYAIIDRVEFDQAQPGYRR
jgi:hypothetical protein